MNLIVKSKASGMLIFNLIVSIVLCVAVPCALFLVRIDSYLQTVPLYEKLERMDNGILWIALLLLLPFLLLFYYIFALKSSHVNVYTNVIQGGTLIFLQPRKFSISYDQVLNVDTYRMGIVLITQYGKYKCPVKNKEELQYYIMNQKRALGF